MTVRVSSPNGRGHPKRVTQRRGRYLKLERRNGLFTSRRGRRIFQAKKPHEQKQENMVPPGVSRQVTGARVMEGPKREWQRKGHRVGHL